jgi:GT2 family glycosyltransferase
MSVSKTYIIILNWNSWPDTLECLESVLRSDYADFQVIVCDNDSHDNSMEYIKAWVDGALDILVPCKNPLRRLSFPPIRKSVSYVEYTRSAAELGGDVHAGDARLVLVHTGANLGFAGGCNVALRYALARDDFGYAWLLNNDTVVETSALPELVRKMEQSQHAGMCGSTLLYYNSINCVQTLGGCRYNKWLAMPRPIGNFCSLPDEIDENKTEQNIMYIAGASILVTRKFIQEIGLMSEQYFLFFEEIDWAVRAEGLFWKAYASKSIVYHKEGSSTGTNSSSGNNSPLSEYYFNKNRVAFTKRYYIYALPTVLFGIMITIINRIRRNQPDNAMMIVKSLLGR